MHVPPGEMTEMAMKWDTDPDYGWLDDTLSR
jgi:hypothetical protein